jgi:hypothetical protein
MRSTTSRHGEPSVVRRDTHRGAQRRRRGDAASGPAPWIASAAPVAAALARTTAPRMPTAHDPAAKRAKHRESLPGVGNLL